MERDDRSSLFDFFAAENKKLKSYVRSKIRSISEMDAEDIVEEVMLSFLNRVGSTGRVDNLSAYIYRSLHNRIIDYYRNGTRTVSLQSFLDEEGEIPLMEFLADSTANVSNEAERKEFMHRLSLAISKLEPKQRAVFIATELKGRSFKELSEEWNEPMGTLLSRKCRAVKALQEMLKDMILKTDKADHNTIITSPVSRFITYSLSDAIKIITFHERRHLNQAKRIMQQEGFPKNK
jgi:RNA polymerase sigma factor (sigma-70 family)